MEHITRTDSLHTSDYDTSIDSDDYGSSYTSEETDEEGKRLLDKAFEVTQRKMMNKNLNHDVEKNINNDVNSGLELHGSQNMSVEQVLNLLESVRLKDAQKRGADPGEGTWKSTKREDIEKELSKLKLRTSIGNDFGENSKEQPKIHPSIPKTVSFEVGSDSNNLSNIPGDIEDPILLLTYILKQNGFSGNFIAAEDIPDDFFVKMTTKNYDSYGNDVISAVRDQDIVSLRNLQSDGKSLQCCNKFGESILHMACRRGFTDVVEYLLDEGNTSPQIRDDYGRTPLHDAFWSARPNCALVEMLIRKCPDLLLVCDKRKQQAISYAQEAQNRQWCEFLWNKRELLKPKILG